MADVDLYRRGQSRLGILAIVIFLFPLLAIGPANAQTSDSPEAAAVQDEAPSEKTTNSAIADSALAQLAGNPNFAPTSAIVNIEAHGADLDAVRAAIAAVGGEPYGEVPGFFVEARIPINRLEALQAAPAVARLNDVTRISNEPVDGSLANNPALTSILEDSVLLDQWHTAGHRGAGQRIGILDIFGAAELQLAISENRIPAPAGTFCQRNGRQCPISAIGGGPHGVGVAEIVHQVAPDAELYFATVLTIADLAAAVEWFGQQGVTVINRSETSELDGPGDGTGPTASIVDRAVELNMVWVAAAGNAGGRGASEGQNWIGEFNDPDGNGFHNFRDGSERMAFTCGFILGMRWDDWDDGTIPTDYDIWIYDTPTARTTESRGDDPQSSTAHIPLEHVNTRCNSETDIDYIAIQRYAETQSDGVDEIQILGNQTLMAEWTNNRSATGPGNDSANPGAVVVGASLRATDNTLAGYSSQGPTFDGRNGVDLLAPSCLPIPDFFSFCFSGTSASAPVIGGIVGVLRGAGLVGRAADIDPLLEAITIDGGTPGPDPQHGHGFLNLPSPTTLGVLTTFPTCNGVRATIIGTAGDDVLVGTDGVDVVFAGAGNDRINGLGGNDIICGGFGDDVILAGEGNDTVFAGPGADEVTGQDGDDAINGGHGHDDIEGNRGDDEILGFTGRDHLKGGLGTDLIRGGDGRDRLIGGDGDDQIFGGNGVDYCRDALEHGVSCRLS